MEFSLFAFMRGLHGIFSYALLVAVLLQIVVSFRLRRAFGFILPALTFACAMYWWSEPAEWALAGNSAQASILAVPYCFMALALLATPVFCARAKNPRKKKK